ncbi:hypothetical protein T492DRAFT_907167 [Pavlovales sp. CCMP2436]|nr:hypothetical protein T492DRAFT_907167 [Pavlovales sp. CCMP2436]
MQPLPGSFQEGAPVLQSCGIVTNTREVTNGVEWENSKVCLPTQPLSGNFQEGAPVLQSCGILLLLLFLLLLFFFSFIILINGSAWINRWCSLTDLVDVRDVE